MRKPAEELAACELRPTSKFLKRGCVDAAFLKNLLERLDDFVATLKGVFQPGELTDCISHIKLNAQVFTTRRVRKKLVKASTLRQNCRVVANAFAPPRSGTGA